MPTQPAPTEHTATFKDPFLVSQLSGARDEHIKRLEQLTGARITVRATEVHISGAREAVALGLRAVEGLYGLVEGGVALQTEDIHRAVRILSEAPDLSLGDVFLDSLPIASSKRRIGPRSLMQKRYLDAIRSNSLVFGIGPAGTGKTYLAMASAVASLLAKDCKRIILCRPAVEAGEKLGFLPGDIAEKVNPYLRPLYDALHDMMDFDRTRHLIDQGVIEVAPLAFMRGRTLNDSFVILDEAQNTTPEQMKMFLTRLGFHSKAVVTGDVTQVDLPADRVSGLIHVSRLLRSIPGIAFVEFSKDDVVRHPLVARIIQAYEEEAAEPT
ncbi:MAG: PhoH family protein [Deltaproteobacteria bacterium]|nr:PhoH family protein [Deltaproteobacteria bacterium]